MNLMCTIAKERLQRDYWERQEQNRVVRCDSEDESDDQKTPTA
ncbi:small protein SR7P [Bacillus atrophaeus]|nr:hypothetical protein [Bacillus atrophaeus]